MEAKTNISQPAEYLGYWEETYKNDLVNDVMPFWLKYGIDKENGGYFTCLNRDGSLMDSNKSVWFQGRFAFILAYAYNHLVYLFCQYFIVDSFADAGSRINQYHA